ncbi:gamma-aminobutyric acid type B receptor subunit 2-like [Dreissena polymorpha]|uniref:gamma-aminobutyric acid type B receptor subunit 2-like n=1 Tax=Dreissena polymorpha TaxID=45954 RepID=UPI0022656428|nr:gamma-aminobutyric acid type B receptor subunit 2-like [Dreissena polymorpha]
MSSPHVNSVILIGCLCMYVVVYVSTVEYLQRYEDGTKGSVCMAKTWLIAIGYTLMFGGMFAKTYRVYIIFKNTTVKRKPIKDHHLFIVVGILLIIDFIILIPWTTVFPFSSEKQIKMMDTLDNNLIDAEVIVYCHNTKQVYWFITMYVYKGLLLAFGTFLAWETRNVTVEELNDSRNIGACIYSVVVVCLIGVPLQHILPTDQINPAYVLETCILLFSTTTCACVIFLPKIHNRNKVRERMLTKPATALSTKNCACSGHPSNLNVVLPGTSMDSSHM